MGTRVLLYGCAPVTQALSTIVTSSSPRPSWRVRLNPCARCAVKARSSGGEVAQGADMALFTEWGAAAGLKPSHAKGVQFILVASVVGT